MVEACPTCQQWCPQEPVPGQPWQHLGADFMTFNGSEYLVVVDYYSKMPIVRKMPIFQCNAAKATPMLKELFAEHGIPESLHTDNGPQPSSSALSAMFADE